MGSSSKSKNSGGDIIVQGSILAIAQIVVRLIGLFYRIPLQRIAGDVAMGYYGYAYDIYTLLLLVSSNGVPLAVSKLVSVTHAKRDYMNEHRIVFSSLLWTLIVGSVIGSVTFIFASQITKVVYGPEMMEVVPALRVLAPTVFLCCVMSTFRGYFQGIGTMMPTAISQIFEQIFNAVVSVGAAAILVSQGPAWAAMGGTLGTCIGALASTIFLIIIYMLYRPQFMKRVRKDKLHKPQSYKEIYKLLTLTMAPVILSSVIYQISGIIDSSLYSNILTGLGYDPELTSSLYGIYSSKYKMLVNVPLAMATALGLAVVPGISTAMINGNKEEIHQKIAMTVKFCMIIAIPSAVGLSVLGGPIMQLLFNDSSALTRNLITIGTPYLLFYSLSTVTVGALQGIDKMKTPIINAAIALGIHVVFIVILLQFCNMNIYAILYSNILFGFLMCLLNQLALKHYIGYEQEARQTFVIPAASAAVMGVVTYFVYKGIYFVIHINAIATLISIIVAVCVYAVALLLLHGLTEEELYSFPKGTMIIRYLRRFHLL
ncbi:MAG: oligosaccharide flippase family protein [Coprococcus sp.]